MFMERVAPVVDATISALARKRFDVDPIAGEHYSRTTSIISSAYKRHGRILETALREGLRESNRHQVWKEDRFRVSHVADGLVTDTKDDAAIEKSSLPYGDTKRTIQLDIIAFDRTDSTIRAYEVKRGFGKFDSGKVRSIRDDLKCVQVLLKSYGVTANLAPEIAESRIIFYYGRVSIPKPWSLTGLKLDEHFGFPIVERVEQANAYFQTKLYALLESI